MDNKIFAYCRVSTKEQNSARQEIAINEYALQNNIEITKWYFDKASGKDFNREGYIKLKEALRQGDTLIIKELDRLGRNMEQIKVEWQDINKLGVDIVVIDNPILNTSNKSDLEKTLISNIVFELLAYMSEKERIKIHQRRMEGIQALKDRNGGKGIGRPKVNIPDDFIKEYKKFKQGKYGDISATQFAKMIGIGRSTLYKYTKILKEDIK